MDLLRRCLSVEHPRRQDSTTPPAPSAAANMTSAAQKWIAMTSAPRRGNPHAAASLHASRSQLHMDRLSEEGSAAPPPPSPSAAIEAFFDHNSSASKAGAGGQPHARASHAEPLQTGRGSDLSKSGVGMPGGLFDDDDETKAARPPTTVPPLCAPAAARHAARLPPNKHR